MKTINIIEDQREDDDHYEKCHELYAYLIMIDSITLAASSHLSVTISITW